MRRRGHHAPGVPVREVRRRSSACTTGSVPVPETSDALHGEGRLDIDLQIIASVLPWVREYRAQPMRLPICVNGRWSHYVPDGRILGLARPLCIEVKPITKLTASPDLDGRKAAIESALGAINEDFAVWTELEIRAEPLFPNAKLVWSNAQNLKPQEVVAACTVLRGTSFSRLGQAVLALGGGHAGWRVALGLVGLKVLAIDLGSEITANSPTRLGARGWI